MADEKKENTGYTPSNPEVSKLIHDFEKELQWDLMARLRGGYVIRNNKDQFEIKFPDDRQPVPLMNDKGIDATMLLVSGFLSRMHGLSIYDDDRIKEICHITASALTRLYAVNLMEFGMTPSKMRVVKVMLMDYFESNIRRSFSGSALKWASQYIPQEQQTQQKEQKKRLGQV